MNCTRIPTILVLIIIEVVAKQDVIDAIGAFWFAAITSRVCAYCILFKGCVAITIRIC